MNPLTPKQREFLKRVLKIEPSEEKLAEKLTPEAAKRMWANLSDTEREAAEDWMPIPYLEDLSLETLCEIFEGLTVTYKRACDAAEAATSLSLECDGSVRHVRTLFADLGRRLEPVLASAGLAHHQMEDAASSSLARRATTQAHGHELDGAKAEAKKINEDAKLILQVVFDRSAELGNMKAHLRAALYDLSDVERGIGHIFSETDDAALTLKATDLSKKQDKERAKCALLAEGVKKLESDLEQLETDLYALMGSIVEKLAVTDKSMTAVFGTPLRLLAGGVKVEVSAVDVDEILGKGALKDADQLKRLDTLVNLLIPKIAETVRKKTGLDASATASLPPDEVAALEAAAEKGVLEILKVQARNKSDRRLTNALQAAKTAQAVLKAAAAGARLAASFGTDPSGYIQAVQAVVTIVAVIREATQSLDTRAAALATALAKVNVPMGTTDKAQLLAALRGLATAADVDAFLKNLNTAANKAAGALPDATTKRRLHGSKTAVLFESWHEAKQSLEGLLEFVDKLEKGTKELMEMLGGAETVEVDGTILTKAQIKLLTDEATSQRTKVTAALEKIETIGKAYQRHVAMQVEALVVIAGAAKAKQAAATFGGVVSKLRSGVKGAKGVSKVLGSTAITDAERALETFCGLVTDNAANAAKVVLTESFATVTDGLKSLVSDLAVVGL